jgi:hypothetical protein
MNKATLAILAALATSLALADDFKTTNGKEYKNVTVSRVEPDGIVIKSKSGISKVYFTELPKEVQERYHYDAAKAAAYSADQAAGQGAAEKTGQSEQKGAPWWITGTVVYVGPNGGALVEIKYRGWMSSRTGTLVIGDGSPSMQRPPNSSVVMLRGVTGVVDDDPVDCAAYLVGTQQLETRTIRVFQLKQ